MSQKISELAALASADVDDFIAIVDLSDTETKKIDVENLKPGLNLSSSDVGLGNVDNTSDVDKPISTAAQTALDDKLESSDIANFETTTQLNTRDTNNRDRINHTGTQAISTIVDLTTELSGKANVAHTHALADLTVSGASSGQVPKWSGTAWEPQNEAGAGTWGGITGTLSDQADLQTELNGKQGTIDGNHGNNNVLGTNSSGTVQAVPGTNINSLNGINQNNTYEPDDVTGTETIYNKYINVEPLQDSPDQTVNVDFVQVNLDNSDSGFNFGTNGQAVRIYSAQVNHLGSGDSGEVQFSSTNFNIGNGTDPIDVLGVGLAYGFGTVNANVNLDGPLQGYGMQLNVNAAATMDPSTFTSAFYDGNNIGCASPSYQSGNFSPTISSINNNTNYSGLNIAPNITTFTGNAGFIGVNVNPTLGTFNNSGYFQGVIVNPAIASVRYASGIEVSMDNVTPFAGVASSLIEQDLTLTFIAPADNNNITLEYTPGGTAGAEVVSLIGNDIAVQIESGVSTAAQVKAALDAVPAFAAAVSITVSGTASNPQVTFGPTNFSGGEFPGNIRAAFFDGDVEITGALTFGGALSVGALNAFRSQAIVNGGGQPSTIHGLITNPTVAASATVALGDTLGVNTAMLLTMGDNSTVTTGFIGVSALALPAVITMGSGATLDRASGAAFVLSLDSSATGGTIDTLDLCRAIAIPNGVTAVTNLYGYKMELPFGDPGTTTWGFYESPGVNNYFQGNLLIGGTAGSDDLVTNSSVAFEIKSSTKAFVNSRMTTTERNALTAINGMQIYNTSTDKLQVYAAGSWVDLH